jgi:hypothetical protein
MKKRYKAKSDVSINVSLPSGKNLHIAFSPITNGGSVYYTDVEDVQKGLEAHSKFGKLFRLDESFDENAEKTKKIEPKPIITTGVKKIVISDPDAAKTYLSEEFGISRTKMKTIKAIKDEAMAHNIEFEGL